MAYLSFSAKGQPLGRRPLTGAITIGRAPDCDISVRDILLSRHHCRLELEGATWFLTDLNSKNGTFASGERITERHALLDGESFTIGQTVVRFKGSHLDYVPLDNGKPIGSRRPSDPWEALEGTVCGYDFNAGRIDVQRVGRTPSRPISQFPKPQPNPSDPKGYAQEDVYSMLTEIASSSWDSIYSEVSRGSPVRTRPMPRPVVQNDPRHAAPARNPNQDLLQAAEQLLKHAEKSDMRAARRTRWRNAAFRMLKGCAVVGQSLLLLGSVLHHLTPVR